MTNKEYHVLALSGGKDSAALAFFIKDNMPEIHEQIEYVFCDTEQELPEIYDYLDKMEIFLDKPITRLKPYKSFDHLYSIYKCLPSVTRRWCTIEMKTKVMRKFLNDKFANLNKGKILLYIGIRADESKRAKQGVSKDNFVNEVYPFVEHGLSKKDVTDILVDSGIGFPDYYKWKSRSGCYFCFYQSKLTWIKLYENHPDLYYKAMSYEFNDCDKIKRGRFGWNLEMSLADMIKPENIAKIKETYKKLEQQRAAKIKEKKLTELFDIDDETEGYCLLCHR